MQIINYPKTKKNIEIRLYVMIDPKISLNGKRKVLIQKGGFIFPLLTRILSSVIGTLLNNN